jgi:protein-disulfide isomerase
MEEGDQENKTNPYIIPGAIIVAGILIAGAVMYSSGDGQNPTNPSLNQPQQEQQLPQAPTSANDIKPVSAEDHIRGNPNAPVKVIEFSDLECPFCQRFHFTMQQVVEDYGDQVAWVYRHFPLVQLHSKASKEAEATECAAELGGNDAFWTYLDVIFEITPANNGLDLTLLPQIASEIGLNQTQFETCLESERYADKVQQHLTDARNSGGTGTPYSIVIAENGRKFVISGAQPYEAVKQVIDAALRLK